MARRAKNNPAPPAQPAAPAISKEVGDSTAAYDDMAARWELIEALNGGTPTMREGAETFLPRETGESSTKYGARLERTFLFNGYHDTVSKITGRPFSKPVTLEGADALPDGLAEIAEDTDREGTDLTQMAREMFREGVDHGLVHLIVDYPRMRGDETRADERDAGARPTLVPVSASRVIGWRSEVSAITGKPALTQLRIRETALRDDGDYGVEEVKQVKLWTPSSWELWEYDDERDQYGLVDKDEHSFGEIPLLTCYFQRTGYMTGAPVLEDLAWLNLAHWQSSSDQRNILRFARTGLWFLSGISAAELKKQGGLKLGPNQYFRTDSEDANIRVVEHSGAAIGAGAKDLRDLEERMELMGLQPFVRLAGYQTATGKAIDEGKNQTQIQAHVQALQRTLTDAYWYAAKWIDQEAAVEKLSVRIFNDFSVSSQASKDLDTLLKARVAGEIDRVTFLRELRRRGVLAEEEEVSEIVDRLEAEGPSLAEV